MKTWKSSFQADDTGLIVQEGQFMLLKDKTLGKTGVFLMQLNENWDANCVGTASLNESGGWEVRLMQDEEMVIAVENTSRHSAITQLWEHRHSI